MTRPRKSITGECRDQSLHIHLSLSEKTFLQERAGKQSLSAYVRGLALGKRIPKRRKQPPIPQANCEMLFLLGSLVEQLTFIRMSCREATRKGQGCNVDIKSFNKLHEQIQALAWAIANIDPTVDEDEEGDT